MERIIRLGKAVLIVCVILSLLSCGKLSTKSTKETTSDDSNSNPISEPKTPVVTPDKKVHDYLEKTKDLIEKSQLIKEKMPACADLNNSFNWEIDVSIDDINNWIADCQAKKPVFEEVKAISDEGLVQANSIEAPEECAELKQKYINFFDETSKHAQRGIDYSDYLVNFCNAHTRLAQIRDDLKSFSPSSTSAVIIKFREFQNKLVEAKNQIAFCGVPNDCSEYQNSMILSIDLLYAMINELISAVQAQSITRIKQIEDDYLPKLDDADSTMVNANSNFNKTVSALDTKLSDLAGEVNNELDNLTSEYDIDLEVEEFFSTPSAEDLTY